MTREYNTKPNSTSFKKGHKKIGGFSKGDRHTEKAKEKVRKSLLGKKLEVSRAWKGEKAGYVAKHTSLVKNFGKATRCENCDTKTAKRYEWANVSGNYEREVSDYRQLCPSCHRKLDHGNFCRKGHEYTEENTRITKEGWRSCRACHSVNQNKYYAKKNSLQGA